MKAVTARMPTPSALGSISYLIQGSDQLATGCDFQYVRGSNVRVLSVTTETGLAVGQTGSFSITTHAIAPAATIRAWTQWDEGDGAVLADGAIGDQSDELPEGSVDERAMLHRRREAGKQLLRTNNDDPHR